MGILIKQKPVKLVVSIIFKKHEHCQCAEEKLKKYYGSTESHEADLPFDRTDYYYKELGNPLRRKLLCFKKLADKEKISQIKITSNKIEDSFKLDGKRAVNIDPGYVTEAKLVLLTTKDYTHRVYIGRRVFAESTLFFQDNAFHSWPWTYPDYASEEMISYFSKVRELYLQDVKKL